MTRRRWPGPALLLFLTGCVPAGRPEPAAALTPAPASQWPEAMRIQQLPTPAPRPSTPTIVPPSRTTPRLASPKPASPKPAPPRPAPVVAPALPAWEARKASTTATEIAASTYTVVAGDTLGRIADKTGAAAEVIARENGIEPPYPVQLGQRLKIPAGRYHRVGRGESGIAIARGYGVEWSRIADLNRLEPPYILREGQRLLIPSKAEIAQMPLEARAAAFRLDIEDLVTGSEPAVAARATPAKPVASAKRAPSPTVAVAEPASFSGRFAWPLTGRILRSFGTFGDGRRNDGINIAADKGDPVAAAADGTVAYAGRGIAIYGGLILIRHGDGWLTAYGNCDALLVTRGQAVKRGQVIARAGETGYVTAPQLHFEIRQGRKPVNPLTLLPAQ